MASLKFINNFPLVLCTFLGLNFTFIYQKTNVQKYKIVTKTRIIQLQMIYVLFETFLVLATLHFNSQYFRIRVALVLQFIQVLFPQFIKLFVVYQAFKLTKFQQNIQSQVNDIQSLMGKHFKMFDNSNNCELKFILLIMLLILARGTKLYLQHERAYLIYHCSTMISELIFSCNDFLFTFYVDKLSNQSTNLCRYLKTMENCDRNKIAHLQTITRKIFTNTKTIESRYSSALFVTISYNFSLLIINLYWLFMRIAYNNFEKLGGTCYLIQTIIARSFIIFFFNLHQTILAFCILFNLVLV